MCCSHQDDYTELANGEVGNKLRVGELFHNIQMVGALWINCEDIIIWMLFVLKILRSKNQVAYLNKIKWSTLTNIWTNLEMPDCCFLHLVYPKSQKTYWRESYWISQNFYYLVGDTGKLCTLDMMSYPDHNGVFLGSTSPTHFIAKYSNCKGYKGADTTLTKQQ